MLGRFISPDPIDYSDEGIKGAGGKDLKTFLNNPQNLNRYTYCLNNPITNLDPDGLLTIFIPGTFSNWENPFSNNYMSTVKNTFNDSFDAYAFRWSGANANLDRLYAALTLSFIINNYNFSEGEKLNIVGFSHGGNVAFMASQLQLKHKIDNLVTLGTPIRDYQYRPNMNIIGRIYNVYSPYDTVQRHLGGGQFKSLNFEFGAASSILPGAINISIPVDQGIMGTHSSLISEEVWNNYISHEIEKYQ